MSRKSKGEAAAADVDPDGATVVSDYPADDRAAGQAAAEHGRNGDAARRPLTPAQERQRAERLARRPRYWIMRLTGNGLPDSVVAILGSRSAAERKVREYASVLRAAPDSLCVFRVSTPDGYRYPE